MAKKMSYQEFMAEKRKKGWNMKKIGSEWKKYKAGTSKTTNKKTVKKKTATKRKPATKKKVKPIRNKEIFKEKPFSDNIGIKKQEVSTIILFAPIIFFVITLATFGYTVFMPNELHVEIITSLGFVSFVLFVITFVYSMMKLNKC